jgi:hypothetical protein
MTKVIYKAIIKYDVDDDDEDLLPYNTWYLILGDHSVRNTHIVSFM